MQRTGALSPPRLCPCRGVGTLLTRAVDIPLLGLKSRVARPHVRDRALAGVAAHHVDAAIADVQVPITLVGNGLRGAAAGAVAVPHGSAVGALRILGGQALAEAVAQLADCRRGHEPRIARIGVA